jgi:hypothetical protein
MRLYVARPAAGCNQPSPTGTYLDFGHQAAWQSA